MRTDEFLKRYESELDSLPYGLGDKIADMLEERDALIEQYKDSSIPSLMGKPTDMNELEREIEMGPVNMVNLAHNLCGIPAIDKPRPHEPFRFQYARDDSERSDNCSIGRENRAD